MLHIEDKRAFALMEREFGGHGHVQKKMRFFEGERNTKGGSGEHVEVSVEVEEHVAHVFREDGGRQ